ncbi:MAG: HNH endonuclease [Candidatus Thorarchaeota archaeon]|jgi:hypothetical protein
MPKSKFPGVKSTKLTEKVERTEVSFQKITEHSMMAKLIKPPHQGALQDDKVDEMVAEYLKTPDFWTHKQIVTISVFNDSYYITDGQHRIEASKILYTRYGKASEQDYLLFNWHTVNNEDEMRSLYNSINKDSVKNEIFITQDVIIQARAENFLKFFKSNYKDLFPNKVNKTNKRYTIEALRDELLKRDFFDKETHQENKIYSDIKSEETLERFLLRSASEYFKQYNYEKYIAENQLEVLFYADEVKFIKEHQVFMFSRNNFLDWMRDKTISPRHYVKSPRKTIPSAIRNTVWKNEYGDAASGKCPITACNTVLTPGDWQCGHIISHYNGGKIKVDNLRPICAQCNNDMSSRNWDEYETSVNQCL